MLITELKSKIKSKNLSDDLLILQYSENSFIVDEYIKQISLIFNRDIVNVDSPMIVSGIVNSCIYVTNVDDLDFNFTKDNIINYKSNIVICKKINSSLKGIVDNYVVVIPNLLNWQIDAYIKTNCPALKQEYIDALVTNYNIYEISNIVHQLKMTSTDPNSAYNALLGMVGYKDINETIFTLIDKIIFKDKSIFNNVLLNEMDRYKLLNQLISSISNILGVQYGLSASELNIKDSAYYVIKNKYKDIPGDKLINYLNFLSGIDKEIKLGQLDISDNKTNVYIVNKWFMGV